jgi:hypothetical protein
MHHFEDDDSVVGYSTMYSRGSRWNLRRHHFVLEDAKKLLFEKFFRV